MSDWQRTFALAAAALTYGRHIYDLDHRRERTECKSSRPDQATHFLPLQEFGHRLRARPHL
jgi:hypothetical protein